MMDINEITIAESTCDAVDLDPDTVLVRAREALTRPPESGWSDTELWVTHTLMFSTPAWDLTDDYIVGESNYRAVLRDYSEKYPEDVSDASFGHWTYSRFNCIKVRVINENGSVTKAFAELIEIATNIEEQYPLYDESLHSELEAEVFDSYLDSVIADLQRERQIETDADDFSEEWIERFKHFIGSENENGYEPSLDNDLVNKAAAFADSGWTYEQFDKIRDLHERFKVDFKYEGFIHWPETATMTPGYVEGWIGDAIYVGVDPNGDSHS